jgi:hypothetical protein
MTHPNGYKANGDKESEKLLLRAPIVDGSSHAAIRFTRRARLFEIPSMRSSLYLGVAVVLAWFATIRFPTWFFNGKEEIDSWFYWAIGPAHAYLSEHLSQTYYFRRWTLNIPNFVVQNILPPMEAQLLLRGVLLVFVLGLSGLLMHSLTQSVGISISIMVVIANFTSLLSSIGRSLHEGTGLVFFLILALVFVRLSRTGLGNSRLVLLAGLAFGLLFVTYQFTIVIIFAMGLSFLVSSSPSTIRELARPILLFTSGFLILSVFDFIIGLAQGGWGYIVTSTFFEFASIRLSGQHSPNLASYLQDFVLTPKNFLLPMLGLGIILVRVSKRKEHFWPLFLIFASLLYFALPFFGMAGAESQHIAVYGLLSALLGSGVLISNLVDEFFGEARLGLRAEFLKLVLMAALVLSAFIAPDSAWFALVTLGGFLGLLVALLARFRKAATLLKVTTSISIASAMSISAALFSQGLGGSTELPKNVDSSLTVMSTHLTYLDSEVRALSEYGLQTDSRMFFIDNRVHEGWSETISSFYGMYSSISEGYPAPPLDCQRMEYVVSQKNPRLVLLHDRNTDEAKVFMNDFVEDCEDLVVQYIEDVPGVPASVFQVVVP